MSGSSSASSVSAQPRRDSRVDLTDDTRTVHHTQHMRRGKRWLGVVPPRSVRLGTSLAYDCPAERPAAAASPDRGTLSDRYLASTRSFAPRLGRPFRRRRLRYHRCHGEPTTRSIPRFGYVRAFTRRDCGFRRSADPKVAGSVGCPSPCPARRSGPHRRRWRCQTVISSLAHVEWRSLLTFVAIQHSPQLLTGGEGPMETSPDFKVA